MQAQWSCSGTQRASSGQGRAAPLHLVLTKGLCSWEPQSKKILLYGIAGETGVKKLSTSSIHAWIPVVFIQHNVKLAPGKHCYLETSHLWVILFSLTCADIRLFINKITPLLLLCTHCLILQETFGLFASVYGKRTCISRAREKRAANWENAFSVSTTVLIALAVLLSNKYQAIPFLKKKAARTHP